MIGRKGQGAMEYLMTYGWAILVVMIVGVVLWQLGIFGGGPGAVNTASGFGKIKPMEPSIKYDSSGLTYSMMNGAGQSIHTVSFTSVSGDCSGATMAAGVNGAGTMGSGEVLMVTGTGCGSKTAGQSFSTVMTIQYNVTVAGSDVIHAETGTIRGVAE